MQDQLLQLAFAASTTSCSTKRNYLPDGRKFNCKNWRARGLVKWEQQIRTREIRREHHPLWQQACRQPVLAGRGCFR